MRSIILLFFGLVATSATAAEHRCSHEFVCARALSMDFVKIYSKRDPLFHQVDQTKWTYGMSANWTAAALYDWLYWDNKMYFDMRESEVKHVGWQFEYGARLGNVQVFWQHHSEHAADETSWEGEFPVRDAYGVRLHFLKD